MKAASIQGAYDNNYSEKAKNRLEVELAVVIKKKQIFESIEHAKNLLQVMRRRMMTERESPDNEVNDEGKITHNFKVHCDLIY